MYKLYLILVLASLQLLVMAQGDYSFPIQVTIKNGIIEGAYDTRTGIQTYFGVPFAKPPVGDLRWKAPQPLEAWSGVKETKAFGPRPVQAPVFSDMVFRSDGLSEDCLYLNVWTPAKRNDTKLPVLVYFYGGGNIAGDASEPRYDGERMAKKGIVVVTCNYRLNIFGFFAHPELSAEAPYKASGNYGMLDQSAALHWVHENIAAFGGDPQKITIAGESAGSIGVSYQMASPLSRNLLAGAIGESGAGIFPTMAPVSRSEAEQLGVEFAQKAGLKTLKDLRALSTRELYELLAETKMARFPVVIDQYFLPKTLPEIFEAREQAQIPLLLGWNSAEIPGEAFMFGAPYSSENFVKRVKTEFPENAEEILGLYPYKTPQEMALSATALASDRFIAFSTWKWFDLHRSFSAQPVFRYLYAKPRPAQVGQEQPSNDAGAPHACEIEYCMGNLHLNPVYAWTPEDYAVSQTMSDFFANFIKTGNPNGDKLPQWPAAKAGDPNPPVMRIHVASSAAPAPYDARYHLLDKIYGTKK